MIADGPKDVWSIIMVRLGNTMENHHREIVSNRSKQETSQDASIVSGMIDSMLIRIHGRRVPPDARGMLNRWFIDSSKIPEQVQLDIVDSNEGYRVPSLVMMPDI